MKVWIDTEFNEGRGALISIALVADDGREFYEVLGCDNPTPWVKQWVMPILNKDAILLETLRERMWVWLHEYKSIELIADHPADVGYFCDLLLLDNKGTWMRLPKLTVTIQPMKYRSALPHNALEDAKALRAAEVPICKFGS